MKSLVLASHSARHTSSMEPLWYRVKLKTWIELAHCWAGDWALYRSQTVGRCKLGSSLWNIRLWNWVYGRLRLQMPTLLKIANAALLCLNQSGQLATLATRCFFHVWAFNGFPCDTGRAWQFRFLNALSGQAPIICQLPDNQDAYRNDFSGQYKSAGFLSPDRAVNCNQTWHLIKRLRLRCKSRQRHLECLQGGFLATQLPSSNPAIYLFRRLTGFPSDTFSDPLKHPFYPGWHCFTHSDDFFKFLPHQVIILNWNGQMKIIVLR